MLELVAADRVGRRDAWASIDLVWTGPEAPGLASRDTGVVVSELFAAADEQVLIAGYAVHQGRQVFRVLAERMETRPALRVRMFLDIARHPADTSLESEILARFGHRFRTREWPGARPPEIYYDPRALEAEAGRRASLHAKCVVIDREVAFVSSANFTEAAQARNIEVGVLVRSSAFAGQLVDHFEVLAATKALRALN